MTAVQAEDVVDVLLTHHAVIEQQFRAVAAAARKPAKRAAFAELARLLTVHETIEQELVHPWAVTHIDAGAEVVADRMDEEHRADEVLAEMFEIEVNDADFDQLLQGLKESVLTHAKHEERYEFPHLRQAGPPQRLLDLAVAVQQAFDTAPTKLPSADRGATARLEAIREQVRETIHASAEDQ